jgi:hypothetical protein
MALRDGKIGKARRLLSRLSRKKDLAFFKENQFFD